MSIFTSFFFSDTTSRDIHTLSLHDALPISETLCAAIAQPNDLYLTEPLQHLSGVDGVMRSEEHTSELQSRRDLVCRLLLEKKKTEKKGLDDRQRQRQLEAERRAFASARGDC